MSAGVQTAAQIEGEIRPTDSPDGLFETLKNSRRRAVLRYLLYEEDPADFRDLVQYVAARENETEREHVTAAQRNRVRTALYQHHLGKLAEHGFIDYDKREGVVSLNGNAEWVKPYIEPAESTDRTLAEYVFGVLLIGIAAITALIPTAATLSALAVGGIGLLLILYTYETSGEPVFPQ